MTDVVVTVDDAHQPHIRAVAASLAERGLAVSGIRPIVGVITGSCPEESMAALAVVPGVSAIARSHKFHTHESSSSAETRRNHEP